ncbi:MAG: hypothetical protein GY891_11605 [Bacteroidetes bacterium]|nr:hypothetical protein [Bacteroidota bacterium]
MKKLVMGVLALAMLNGCAVGTTMRGGKQVKVYRKDIKATSANSKMGRRPCSDEW